MNDTSSGQALLRRALLLDAAVSGAFGILLALAAGALGELLGLPTTLLRETGILLVPFAGFLVWLATRARIARSTVWTIVAGNCAWTVASVMLLVSGWVSPTMIGEVFVIAQAAAVVVLTYLEYDGMRREQSTLSVRQAV